ncbi:TCP-1/cpn60 chaperonin family protein [Perilla frutescens var. hirtella]|nr:TCP-1/cpn60 chaperonin family protein [Perilla frutescens var. hirtella]
MSRIQLAKWKSRQRRECFKLVVIVKEKIGGGESQGSSQRQRSKTRGYGVHLDLNIGQTTLNPGRASEVVVSLGENTSQTSMVIDVDPHTRYPFQINERELKNKDKRHAPCSATATRKIKFVGDGLEQINACMAVADVVRTTLGLRAMDKLIHDDKGNTTISNDGATIMKLLEIVHPVAKILVDIAKSQDSEALFSL